MFALLALLLQLRWKPTQGKFKLHCYLWGNKDLKEKCEQWFFICCAQDWFQNIEKPTSWIEWICPHFVEQPDRHHKMKWWFFIVILARFNIMVMWLKIENKNFYDPFQENFFIRRWWIRAPFFKVGAGILLMIMLRERMMMTMTMTRLHSIIHLSIIRVWLNR